MKNKVYITDDGQKIYKDRSVGVVMVAATCDENKRLFVLCNRRGNRTSECKRKWNLPSGYLDWDESGMEAAVRETFEECGIKIPLEYVTEVEHSTLPTENRQNVIFRYLAMLPSSFLQQELTMKNSELDEVTEVKWIPIDELDKYEFAWKQADTIKRILCG